MKLAELLSQNFVGIHLRSKANFLFMYETDFVLFLAVLENSVLPMG